MNPVTFVEVLVSITGLEDSYKVLKVGTQEKIFFLAPS